ncbi:MAG: ATP-dependent helicase C-terminal domain-containing protein, partial [Asticcacaulis sp.]
ATDWSRLVQETRKAQSEDTGRTTDAEAALLLAEAWPERVALPRVGKPGSFVMANGRGVFVEPSDALARAEALAVGDLGGGSSQDRILLAAPLDPEALKTRFKDRLVRQETITLDDQGRVRAVSELCLGKLVLESRRLDSVTPAMLAEALKQEVLRKGLSVLAFGEESQSLRSRVAFLRGFDPEWPDLSDAALMDRLDDWLTPILGGVKRLSDLSDSTLAAAVGTLIPWALSQSLDKLAPERLSVPTGSRLRIDYAAEGGPRLAVRVQELYGLKVHPSLAGGKVPLTLSLLSPAQRPVQTTRDLPGFWAGSWKEVRTEMKGRYPRHVWPEDPANADPTTRAKPRGT